MRTTSALKKPAVKQEAEQPQFPIEKGIPIPPDTRAKKYNFGFERLKVGESVFVPLVEGLTHETQRQNVYRYCQMAKDVAEGEFHFTIRKVDNKGVEGFRVWRTEA